MSQPVRKQIQEIHSDIIKEKPIYTLLVDGNSLLFSCFADDKINSEGVHYGGVYQFLLQLRMLMQKKDFDYIYVFFDNEYSGWLRWDIYKPYKQNRDKNYEDYALSEYMKACNAKIRSMQDYFFNKNKKKETPNKKTNKWEEFIDANFDRERDILCRYFNELFIRWYIDEIVEGDDLISYYCLNKKPEEKIVIVSSDMDLSQLLSDDICIYNQKKKKFITNKNFSEYFGYYYENTLIKKIFCGDVSDNIGNIKGLSEEGFAKMMPEYTTKKITVEDVKERAKKLIDERVSSKKKPLQVHENIVNGVSNKKYDGDFYDINEKIIDLKHPLLTDDAKNEMDAMMYAPQDPDGRSFENLYEMINEDGIIELIGATKFASFFNLYKRLTEKEIKRYNEEYGK